ncbi:acyl-CoA thioesterase [Thalassotalea eurytherma]|uniref:Thioesterase n=1 Tax=Thalassotalea eurytherma TaxID=1144278 RepID=A0ABQ6H8L0_9GAMM|nr:thioesterase family protein [Thalassotalea eurytherma]GLX83080.1 thioesterase [Thalassotalea eurytherma]
MFKESFSPRFSDTDALGHINNTLVPIWFEAARKPIFELFIPDLDPKKWNLILANIDVSFKAQMYFGHEMEVRTCIQHVGNSSFKVYQELWQQNQCCASGAATMVHYDYSQQKSATIPQPIKEALSAHLYVENN